jgi:hypothetical protein
MMLLVSAAWAFDPVVEELSDGARIDWTALQLEAGATGTPGGANASLETMEGDARTRLGPRMLALARQVRVTSDRTGGDVLDAGDPVADRLDDNLALWEVTETRYFTSGRVEIDGALPLQAWLRPALASWAKGREEGTTPATTPTGLVVDARGLAVKPAIAPKVEGPGGEVLYAAETLTALAATQRGPVVYVRDPADPAAAKRAGEQPLFVRATATDKGVDLVLSAEDAAAVRKAAETAPFLLGARVVVVVSP